VKRTLTTGDWLDEVVPAVPGGTLRVDLQRGSVRVESHDSQDVRLVVEIEGWGVGEAEVSVESRGGDVAVELHLNSWLPGFLVFPGVKVRAWIPSQYSLEVRTRGGRVCAADIGGSVDVASSGGRIELYGADGPVRLATSGGRAEAEDVADALEVRTSGGRIQILSVDGPVVARTSGGVISVEDAAGQVDAKTSGGSIFVEFAEQPCGKIETSGGAIEVAFPADTGMDLDAQTSGGRVRVDPGMQVRGEQSRSRVRAEINGGGRRLRLRTSGGGIQVQPRSAPAEAQPA
jgi:hypothetical protein